MSISTKSYLSLISTSALSSARSRPISAERASSAPARSIDATAMSTSTVSITSEIGTLCTSTSNIERSIASGFIPWLMVRLPCGSRSIRSTRWPSSCSATPRFSVVVVFATPPFWFANAMTLAVTCSSGAGSAESEGTAWSCGLVSAASSGWRSLPFSTADRACADLGKRRERPMRASPSSLPRKLLQSRRILGRPTGTFLRPGACRGTSRTARRWRTPIYVKVRSAASTDTPTPPRPSNRVARPAG